ncbi:MAG: hypothetical protein EBX50_13940 [Chitinophagia bacterium]|nr:hypothetical protein [Chitinophagia bacterium]
MSKLLLEQNSQSQFSPGLVRDDESLARLQFHPEHIKDGQVIETAISIQDLTDRGYSIARKVHIIPDTFAENARRMMEKVPEQRSGVQVSVFETSKIRELKFNDTERAFVVVDDALENDIAHACVLSAYERKSSQIRKLRGILLPHLQSLFHLDEFLKSLKKSV